ncbi:DUF4861 family protein [Sphingomonas sp. M1-B02]|uniref:DUF4861 family protein n=1 Tax=Sphingomonas sp. M1-B02 TaxID=3114300 RepID=UPI00223F98CE|nr:DUF4861 family protein [Sphingomonas sp. S6-11]UZK64668.1 DUF4861 domain-containing protein [Sphingomonas sp. S6-11]
MRKAFLLMSLAIAALPGAAPGQDRKPMAEAADKTPRASVVVAPYRYDDLLWENDRTAHRIYGRPLETKEPPSSSGIDAWGKNVRYPFMERQLQTGDQHGFHGEGLDFYNVGTARGAGGLGIWHDNKLWASRNYRAVRILKNGPDVARFEVDYAPWPVDVVRKVWETRRFSLPMGTNFTRMTSTLQSDKPDPLTVAIGLARLPHAGAKPGTFTADVARGIFTWWGPADAEQGVMGLALLIDPKTIERVGQDSSDHLVLVRQTPGKPFVYYMGATWSKSPDFQTRKAWEAYVRAAKPDFDPSRD